MATNRPYDLDEAMHRRIMIAIEFRQPDHILRKSIWENHIPDQLKLAEDVDMVRMILISQCFQCASFATRYPSMILTKL